MLKKLFIVALMLLGGLQVWAYNMSAVVPSGQTLYFNYSGSDLIVTHPNYATSSDGFSLRPLWLILIIIGIVWFVKQFFKGNKKNSISYETYI